MSADLNELLILCEGELEERVLRNFLSPYWRRRFANCQVLSYHGNGDFKTQVGKDTRNHLHLHRKNYVLCLVDLYNEPFKVYNSARMTPEDGFHAVREKLVSMISPDLRDRFGPFPVVIEIEAWLLADPEVQKVCCPNRSFPLPETILHPKAELDKAYKARKQRYSEVINGQELFGRASATRVYDDSAPHFRLMIDWLLDPPIPVKTTNAPSDRQVWTEKLFELTRALESCVQAADQASTTPERETIMQQCEDLERQIAAHAAAYPAG